MVEGGMGREYMDESVNKALPLFLQFVGLFDGDFSRPDLETIKKNLSLLGFEIKDSGQEIQYDKNAQSCGVKYFFLLLEGNDEVFSASVVIPHISSCVTVKDGDFLKDIGIKW